MPQQKDSLSNSYQTAAEKRVHELTEAWCSAYSEMNAREMTSLEADETEIVEALVSALLAISRKSRVLLGGRV
jgi:hypothetical protein